MEIGKGRTSRLTCHCLFSALTCSAGGLQLGGDQEGLKARKKQIWEMHLWLESGLQSEKNKDFGPACSYLSDFRKVTHFLICKRANPTIPERWSLE